MTPVFHRSLAKVALIVVFSTLLSLPPLWACVGKAIPPSCGRTVVITAGIPQTLLSSGGDFDVPTFIYLGLAEFPPGSGLCPPGPFEVDVDLEITCTPAGDGGGSVLDLVLEPGYTAVDVPVSLPVGPPRICNVTATAEVGFGGSSTVTATNDRIQVCLVEESASQPGLPRLDLELLGDPLVPVHPGDQSGHRWRLTNRDPSATFTGDLVVETENQSRVPSATGIVSPVDGVFSPSDPGAGDNFPIAFADEVLACVPLPPNPLDPTIPTLLRPLVIPPGGFEEIEILTRPWGMCSDGSCTQSVAVVDGEFSDVTPGFACGSFATVTDVTVPPGFLWPDTGSSAFFLPPVPELPELPFVTQAADFLPPSPFLFITPDPVLILPGEPPLGADLLLPDLLDPERGRIQATFQLPQPVPVGDPFDLVLPFQFVPEPSGDLVGIELISVDLLTGAPTGFDNLQPVIEGELRIETLLGGQSIFHQLDFVLQLDALAFDPQLQALGPLQFQNLQLLPIPPDPLVAGFQLSTQALVLQEGAMASTIVISQDLRAHGAFGASVFADGFETGDTARWSSTSP